MSRATKELIEEALKKQYAEMDSVMVVSVHGLKGTEVNELRGELQKQDIEVHVVKNRAAKRVLSGTRLESIGSILTGPCAFVTGGKSPVDTAKELIRLAKEYPTFELRSGIVEGETDPLPIEAISKRKSREELVGEIVMLAISPARRIAGCLNVGGKIAGCLKAIADKGDNDEPATEAA
jgi:large subunit ribosomal protein L10